VTDTGAAVDRAYDGSVIPLAGAGAVMATVGYACYRWADAVWERSAGTEIGGR
jgi:hypothetical protein